MLCETNSNTQKNNDGHRREHQGDRLVLTPRADVRENAESIVLTADLPGVTLANVNIALEKDLLVIEGAQTAANGDGYELTYAEYEPCHFHRAFRIESHIERDKITASMQGGVLRVTLPKAAPAKISKIYVAVSA